MIFLKTENELVTFVHYMPFDGEHGMGKTKEELEQEGILVESIPEPKQNGKIPKLFVNRETKELWYEYSDRPPTQEEEMEQLKQQMISVTAFLNMLLLPPEL